MNDTQTAFVNDFIEDSRGRERVLSELEGLSPEAYKNEGFREMLFAFDATNRLCGDEWHRIFIRGLIEFSGWSNDGRLDEKTYSEIAELHGEYGYGEYGVTLVVDLYEEVPKQPVNSTSFTRRTLREYFNGVQPISENVLFTLKRFLAKDAHVSDEDAALLIRVCRETRGLMNAGGFDEFFSKTLVKWSMESRTIELLVRDFLAERLEFTEAEKLLIKELNERGFGLDAALLGQIDLRRERLMGMI